MSRSTRRTRPRRIPSGEGSGEGHGSARLGRALVVASAFTLLSLRSMHRAVGSLGGAPASGVNGTVHEGRHLGILRAPADIQQSSSLQSSSHRRNIRRDPFLEPLTLAPWDPANSAGGHRLIEQSCGAKLKEAGCEGRLPLFGCLVSRRNETSMAEYVAKADWITEECKGVMDPCSLRGAGDRCRAEWEAFHVPALADSEAIRAEELMRRMHLAFGGAEGGGVWYWMTAGSAVGGLYHHSRIPWDDDFDIYILKRDVEKALERIKRAGLAVRSNENEMESYPLYKVYDPHFPSINPKRKATHSYPFIDVFPIECKGEVCSEKNGLVGSIDYARDSIFPLKWRPFGRLSLPFPNRIVDVVEDRYGKDAGTKCIRHAYNHKSEIFRGRRNHFVRNCTDLSLPPALVVMSNRIADGGKEPIRPWPIDLPNVTVEHLMDGDVRLSSVIFSDGDEVRRSYADGLMNVAGDVITFHAVGTSAPLPLLVPFLDVERRSYAENDAGQTAEALNLEIMPMLDTPEVGNHFASGEANTSPSGPIRLRVGEWNAERGTNWDVFEEFFPNADIVILNEMDWGMARSGNIHTIRAMAESLRMNYAYGVEFLELTNGNKKEIEATTGRTNLAGYHGNAVLSRWPLSDVKVLRLHPLYDKLYAKKTGGMDEGERRLGGRMALFATTHIGDESILLVSVHSHAGSPKNLFRDDALAVCKEIRRRNATNVLLGGDTGPPFTSTLVSDCGFHPLEKTNKRKGRRFQPTWRVDCPDGGPPHAKFSRGDWLLARGPGFPLAEQETVLSVLYPYKKLAEGKYDCISDHAMIAMETDFVYSSATRLI